MNISLDAVTANPWMLVFFVSAILVVRGGPILLVERLVGTAGAQSWRNAGRLALYGATGLPIIVAVTGLAVSEGLMPSDIGSLLVAAGAASVLLFPLIAKSLSPKK